MKSKSLFALARLAITSYKKFQSAMNRFNSGVNNSAIVTGYNTTKDEALSEICTRLRFNYQFLSQIFYLKFKRFKELPHLKIVWRELLSDLLDKFDEVCGDSCQSFQEDWDAYSINRYLIYKFGIDTNGYDGLGRYLELRAGIKFV